jgi:glycosyltransferase involved in cell wall biosynthesis
MTYSPKISVLMSVHNGAKYLKESIKSILNQTFSDFEFIIVNDASTDNSLEIIKSFSDSRIVILNNPENLGLTKSLNIGLKQASGKYIARLDADDLSFPDRLEKQLSFMEKNIDISLIGSWAKIIDNKGQFIKNNYSSSDSNFLKFQISFIKNPLIHSSIFFKKEILKEIKQYDENFIYAQDFSFYSKVIKRYKISVIPQTLIEYRNHAEAISHIPNKLEIQRKNAKKIIFKNINFYCQLDWKNFSFLYKALNRQKISLTILIKSLFLWKKIFQSYILKENLSYLEIKKITPLYYKKKKGMISQFIKNYSPFIYSLLKFFYRTKSLTSQSDFLN